MREKRYIRIRNMILARVVPILILFAAFTLMFSTSAFSSGGGAKYIVYKGDVWNINESFNKNWATTGSTVTFTVDLDNDFKGTGDRPFTVEIDGGSLKRIEQIDGKFDVTADVTRTAKFTISILPNTWANSSDSPIVRSFTITKIDQGPVISITGAEDNGIYSGARTININIKDGYTVNSFRAERTDLNGQKESLGKLENGSFKQTLNEEGRYNFYVSVTDSNGEKSDRSLNFTIDRSGPEMTANRDNDTIRLTIKDLTLDLTKTQAALYHGGTVIQPNISFVKKGSFTGEGTVKLPKDDNGNIKDGVYIIEWQSQDGAGKSKSGKISYTIGDVKPAISISGVKNGEYYNTNKQVTISMTNASPEHSKVTVTRNNKEYNAGSVAFSGGTAVFSHTFNSEGNYVITVEAGSSSGNKSTRTVSFTIDKTGPVITPYMRGEGQVIKNGAYYNKTFTPVFILNNDNDWIVSVTMNGRDVTGNIPTLTSEGKYYFTVKAMDKAGNVSELNLSFTIDMTPPTLDISGVMEGYLNEDVVPFITYHDDNLDTQRTRVTLNGEPYESGTKLEAEQEYVLEAYIVDLAGNVTETSMTFTIDKTAPVIKFTEPISAQYFSGSIIPELLIEDLSDFEILSMTLNGEPYEIGQKIEKEGKHLLEIQVKDKAGNVQTIAVEFTIDMTPPELIVEGVKKNGVYSDPVFIKIGLADPQDRFLRVTVNGELFKGEVVEKKGEKYIRITVHQLGDHEIKVIAVDEAGNKTELVIPFSIVEKTALAKFVDNKPLFAGTIAGAVIILSAAGLFGYRYIKRRREGKQIEEDYFS